MSASVPPRSASSRIPRQHARGGMLLATAALLVTGPAAAAQATPAAHPAAVEAACSPALAPAAAQRDEPWPQGHYDLAAVHRVEQGDGVTVAVLDSGVDSTHPQLAGAVQGGGDLLDPAGDGLEDCAGHGTAVASIVAARPAAGIAFVGVAPQATILSIRVGDRRQTENGMVGSGDIAALVGGIEAAVAARPAVMNLSISTTTDSPALRAAIESALAADIVVVAAVGNFHDDGNPTPYPAAYEGVVGVGAVDVDGARLAQSQVGPYLDLVAPGGGVLAAAPIAGHVAGSGTSYAAPFVAGTAALIRARWPELDRAEVVRRLLATADPPSGGQPSDEYGYGVVNPLRALTEVVPPAEVELPEEAPEPVVEVVLPGGTQAGPSPQVLVVAGALLVGAVGISLVAIATPAGRRRGWRPGRIDVSPLPTDEGHTYLDDFATRPYDGSGAAVTGRRRPWAGSGLPDERDERAGGAALHRPDQARVMRPGGR